MPSKRPSFASAQTSLTEFFNNDLKGTGIKSKSHSARHSNMGSSSASIPHHLERKRSRPGNDESYLVEVKRRKALAENRSTPMTSDSSATRAKHSYLPTPPYSNEATKRALKPKRLQPSSSPPPATPILSKRPHPQVPLFLPTPSTTVRRPVRRLPSQFVPSSQSPECLETSFTSASRAIVIDLTGPQDTSSSGSTDEDKIMIPSSQTESVPKDIIPSSQLESQYAAAFRYRSRTVSPKKWHLLKNMSPSPAPVQELDFEIPPSQPMYHIVPSSQSCSPARFASAPLCRTPGTEPHRLVFAIPGTPQQRPLDVFDDVVGDRCSPGSFQAYVMENPEVVQSSQTQSESEDISIPQTPLKKPAALASQKQDVTSRRGRRRSPDLPDSSPIKKELPSPVANFLAMLNEARDFGLDDSSLHSDFDDSGWRDSAVPSSQMTLSSQQRSDDVREFAQDFCKIIERRH